MRFNCGEILTTVLTVLGFFTACSAARGSKSISTIYPPQIENYVSEEIIFNAGDNISLTCTGRHPLSWKIVNTSDIYERIRISEKVEVNRDSTSYTSELVIVDTVYSDTNFIICYYEGTSTSNLLENLENSTSIYIYVYDPEDLFVPTKSFSTSDLIIQPIYQHLESVIPCRPSHPDVNVTLVKEPGNIVSTDSGDISFDPRRGFVLYYPNIYFSTSFECIGVMGNTTKSLTIFLFWHPDTSGPPPPHIETGQYASLNQALHLTCIVSIETGTMLLMNWTHPPISNSRVIESKTAAVDKTSNNGYKYREVRRNLTVNNVEMSDQGFYKCIVADHTGKTNHRDKYVKVLNNTCHLHATQDVTDTLTVLAPKQKDVRFIVRFEAYNSPEVHWYKNKSEIKPGSGIKYSINTTDANSTLVIKQPRRKDTAVYTMAISLKCGRSRELSFDLNVLEEPSASLHKSDQTIFLRGTKAEMTCIGEGNPVPRLSWDWRSCLEPNCTTSYWPLGLNKSANQEYISQPIRPEVGVIQTTIKFATQVSGYYRCNAWNDYGRNSNGTLIIVTDFKDGFAIHSSTVDVIDTTPVTLKCGASIFKYTSLSWEWRPNKEGYGFNPIKPNHTDRLVQDQSKGDTIIAALHLKRVKLSDSGEYKCTATGRYTGQNYTTVHRLIVKTIEAPLLTPKSNLNGSTIYVSFDESFQLVCDVMGRPYPTISWWKNGQLLNDSNKEWLDFSSSKRYLNIKRVRIEDAGIYVCVAQNLGGNLTSNVSIQVLGDTNNLRHLRTEENNSPWTISLVVAVVIVSAILIFAIGFILRKYKKEQRNRRELEMISQMLFEHGDPNSYNPDLPLDDQVELLPYDKRWEFPKERLKLGKTLGQGAFGRVVKAEAIGLQDGEAATTVAVKMLKQRADMMQKKALMQELKVMIHLGRHLNVVNLLGAVTKNIKKGELLVIVEFCRFGNMRHFLLRHRDNFINQIDPKTGKINQRINDFHHLDENSASQMKTIEAAANTIYGQQNRPLHYADLKFSSYKNTISSGNDSDDTVPTDMSTVTMSTTAPKSRYTSTSCDSGGSDYLVSYGGETKDRPLTTCDLLCYAFQVSRGMEYLSSRKLVHRDLAARNILLADDNVVKICDFGLAKDLYKYSNYKRKGDGPLPIKWMALESVRDKVFSSQSDVWSFGIVLWEFFTLGGSPYPGIEIDEEFYKKLKNGYRMDQPECATAEVYEIMQSCWRAEGKDRPTFTELVEDLGGQLEASIRKYYVDLNNPYMTMNDTFKNNNDYLTMETGEERNYVNIDHVISPPSSREYVNVSSRPRVDSINSDYLSMQSPIKTNFNHTNSPFHGYTNVDKFRADNVNAVELKPLTQPESPDDPWIPRDLGLPRSPPLSPSQGQINYVMPIPDQTDYLFMGNRDSNFHGKSKTGSGSSSSDSSSSGFHSDFTENSPPPSYSVVVGQNEYV